MCVCMASVRLLVVVIVLASCSSDLVVYWLMGVLHVRLLYLKSLFRSIAVYLFEVNSVFTVMFHFILVHVIKSNKKKTSLN